MGLFSVSSLCMFLKWTKFRKLIDIPFESFIIVFNFPLLYAFADCWRTLKHLLNFSSLNVTSCRNYVIQLTHSFEARSHQTPNTINDSNQKLNIQSDFIFRLLLHIERLHLGRMAYRETEQVPSTAYIKLVPSTQRWLQLTTHGTEIFEFCSHYACPCPVFTDVWTKERNKRWAKYHLIRFFWYFNIYL